MIGASVVVLAGGRSSRFGSAKLEATLDDRPLLDHVIELAQRLSDDVVVALPPTMPVSGIERASGAGVRTIQDPEPFGGPLVGLAAALAVVDRPITIVLAGDMPRMGIQILEPMLIVLGQHDDVDAVVLEDTTPRPLPLILRTESARDAARAILDGTGERSLRALVAALRSHVIEEGHWRALDPNGTALADVDRPEDLDTLRSG